MALIQVVDTEMDDEEFAVQQAMYQRIMDVCGGQPARRALQVLVDTLACVAVASGCERDELVEAFKASYEDALPKESAN